MATKRGLYKPVQTNVGKKRNRRPLVQGRLVTASAHPPSTAPRLQQGVVNEEEDHGVLVTSQLAGDDPNATPRRAVPRVTQKHSPVAAPPIHTLDLSDSEEDQPQHHHLSLQGHTPSRSTASQSPRREFPVHTVPHVKVLDASQVTGSPHQAETECIEGYERSPATVIRHDHSPSRNPRPAREEAVWKIPMDEVTKVKNSSPTSQASAISPLAVATASFHAQHTEQSADGDMKSVRQRPRDGDVETLVSRSSGHKKVSSVRKTVAMGRLAQPSFEDSGESERMDGVGRTKKPAVCASSEMTSDSDTCSLFEYVPQASNRPKTAGGSSKAVPPKSAKKKKGERTVASRYMQSTKSKRVTSAGAVSADKTLQHKKNISHGSSINTNNSGSHQLGRRVNNKSRSTPRVPTGISPDRQQDDAASQGKTSTPTHEGVPNMVSCDASAIHPELSMLSAMEVSHLRLGAGSGSGLSGNHGSPRKQKKVDLRMQQHRVDVAYAHYLQWLFLDTKAVLTLQQPEKQAMQQLHALWGLLEKSREEKGEVEREVARLRHLNLLDQQLDTQHQALEPVIKVLPILQKDYSGLAQAVDTTRHQIATQGIHLPEDDHLYLERLERVLMESEELLGKLSTLTSQQSPAVNHLSQGFQAVQQAVDTQCVELNRCGELLSALQSLTTHENSLRIQAMQASK